MSDISDHDRAFVAAARRWLDAFAKQEALDAEHINIEKRANLQRARRCEAERALAEFVPGINEVRAAKIGDAIVLVERQGAHYATVRVISAVDGGDGGDGA